MVWVWFLCVCGGWLLVGFFSGCWLLGVWGFLCGFGVLGCGCFVFGEYFFVCGVGFFSGGLVVCVLDVFIVVVFFVIVCFLAVFGCLVLIGVCFGVVMWVSGSVLYFICFRFILWGFGFLCGFIGVLSLLVYF